MRLPCWTTRRLAEEAVLRQLQVRLGFAAAAAEDEINMLAVEGLQQTLDEAIADDTFPNTAHSWALAELNRVQLESGAVWRLQWGEGLQLHAGCFLCKEPRRLVMSIHTATLAWTRKDAIFTDGKYPRAHVIGFDGGQTLTGSPAPDVVRPPLSDPNGTDPEEMLVAAVASCHMLFFLDFARRPGLSSMPMRMPPKARWARMRPGSPG
jgi:hypothetical protein